MTLGTANPTVSVIVPMLNEIDHIRTCLDGFETQTYPKQLLEVLVVDGGSTDGSRALVDDLAKDRSCIRIVDNPQRRAAAAFNRGVEAASGDVVCLFSAHGIPDADYVQASVDVLFESGASGVGGLYRHEGTDATSAAIGLAMVSPIGMASPHRFAAHAGDVDTISHPAYVRSALIEVGPFDETLERNSDYELNWRLREAGHRLVFDPRIGSVYRPRSSLAKLARQFWWYGRWKVRVLELHPASLQARHLVPPMAVVAASATPILMMRRSGRRWAGALAAGYVSLVLFGIRRARPSRHGASATVLAAAFPVMHASWGAGFVASVAETVVRRRAA